MPELKDLPAKYIYEPWKAPIADQKRAGVVIGEDKGDRRAVYPKPMFDFAKRRDVCIQGLKEAYRVGLYGDNPKVADGSWKELFDDRAEGPTKDGAEEGPVLREEDLEDEGQGEFEVQQDEQEEEKEEEKEEDTRKRKRSSTKGSQNGHINSKAQKID